jgi:hypothetical protein
VAIGNFTVGKPGSMRLPWQVYSCCDSIQLKEIGYNARLAVIWVLNQYLNHCKEEDLDADI